jgi:F-type H+-transporting ATPase subunit beta
VAEKFSGMKGAYVPVKETVRGFTMILNGECDSVSEQAFFMAGGIDEVLQRAS